MKKSSTKWIALTGTVALSLCAPALLSAVKPSEGDISEAKVTIVQTLDAKGETKMNDSITEQNGDEFNVKGQDFAAAAPAENTEEPYIPTITAAPSQGGSCQPSYGRRLRMDLRLREIRVG